MDFANKLLNTVVNEHNPEEQESPLEDEFRASLGRLILAEILHSNKTELEICQMEHQLKEILHMDELVCMVLLAHT
jgi:flagellar biosynthesis component FlhA